MAGGGDEDIEEGAPKIFRKPKGVSEKIVGLGGGSEILYTSKPIDTLIIIQIGWLSTQQFNDLCNSAISRGLHIQLM